LPHRLRVARNDINATAMSSRRPCCCRPGGPFRPGCCPRPARGR